MKRYFGRLSEKQDALHCMILTTEGNEILLPSVVIAEICHDLPVDLTSTDNVKWRNSQVPLLSFNELYFSKERDFSNAKHIAVLHSLDAQKDFGAIVIDCLPQVLRLEHNDLSLPNEQLYDKALSVMVNEHSIIIPEL